MDGDWRYIDIIQNIKTKKLSCRETDTERKRDRETKREKLNFPYSIGGK